MVMGIVNLIIKIYAMMSPVIYCERPVPEAWISVSEVLSEGKIFNDLNSRVENRFF